MSEMKLALLGRLSIDREGEPSTPRALPGGRAELVFAYLAAEHRRVVTRDELADALWPGLLPDTWAAALRGVVSEVRRFLGDAGLDPSEVLFSTGGGYQLRLPRAVVVDVDEARTALVAAGEALAAGDAARAAALAERAGALARLPFLPSHEGAWVDGVRAELESVHTRALELQARAHARAADRRAAADAAERLVHADPFSEPAHRLRIAVLAEVGDRAGAAAAYAHCRAVLAAELGIEPSPETTSAFRRAFAASPAAGDAAAGDLAAYSVLVVEDHDFQRRTAVRLLGGLGVGTIAEAADGAAALEAIGRGGPPDVIVCDLEMPGMDGVEFIRHVGERELASGLIISSAMDAGVVHAVEALAEAYGLQLLGAIEKPLTARRLGELLAAHRRGSAPRAGEDARPAVTPADIAAALDEQRIVVRFRPLVDLVTGTVSGAETVPVWHDATHGWIGPQAFLPALEPGALVTRFAEHVIDLACVRVRDFARAGLDHDLTVQLPAGPRDTGMAARFAEIARGRDADPRRIVCGIGERALRRDPGELAALARLRLKGFGLSLEEFGNAHRSADQLARLPLTAVKLAAPLVSGAAGDARRTAALEQALDVARELGVVAAAAGCDSAEDFELLVELGCRHAQGAYIGDAIDGDELAATGGRWNPPSPVGAG